MLTKPQFLDRLDFIKKFHDRMDNFDAALRKFANSDFTGYFDEPTYTHLCDCLAEDMGDKNDWISWWMCETDWGARKDMCNIYDSKTEEIIATVDTPEKLYDYLFTEYTQSPSKDTLRMAVKAQDNGIKFATRIIDELIKTNTKTKNPQWEERDALLELTKSKIINDYLIESGVRDLQINTPPYIISLLDEES